MPSRSVTPPAKLSITMSDFSTSDLTIDRLAFFQIEGETSLVPVHVQENRSEPFPERRPLSCVVALADGLDFYDLGAEVSKDTGCTEDLRGPV